MVVIEFVTGDKESIEPISVLFPWEFDKESQSFVVRAKDGKCVFPIGFVKSIRCVEV